MPTVVNCILQDRIGFLWFATNSGLYKYDGYNFTSYKHDIDDSTSLRDNEITTLYEDRRGGLWAGTWVGLEKFDREANTFTHYKPGLSDSGSAGSNNIWAIREDGFGKIWIGTSHGLFRFDKITEKFECFKHDSTDPRSISHSSINAIYEDEEEQLWIGTQVGLDRFDAEQQEFIHCWIDEQNRYRPWYAGSNHRINAIFEDEAGIFWLGTNRGLVECDPEGKSFSTYHFIPKNPVNRITAISQDVLTGSLWLATPDGLFSFDKKSKQFTRYSSEATCVLSEQSGTLWIGTNTEVKKVNRTKHPFKTYRMNDVACAVRNFGNEETVWIMTLYGTWKRFDTKREQFIPYSFGDGLRPHFVFSQNEMLLQTEKGGRYVTDTLGNMKQAVPDSLAEFSNALSYACKTKKGYWSGGGNGGFYFHDPKTLRITKIGSLGQSVSFMYEDRTGLLWIATFMGKTFCYDPESGAFVESIADPEEPSSMSGRHVTQIYEDTKGRLWFATTSGLHRYDRSTKAFSRFSERSGLIGNNVRGILEDSKGYLWISTNNGISKFDPETNHFKNYDISYGLEPTTDALFGYGCKKRNGEMYFPGARGFTRFHPDSVRDNPFIPPVVITSFKRSDRPYPFSSEVRLPYDDNFLSFEFAALSYISPERNQYSYRMEGVDKDWVYAGTRRYASYPNLSPGKYIFRVKGSNNDAVWNEAGASILITIFPPWWKTWWAYSAYAVLFLSLLYGLRRYDLNRIALRNQVERDQAVLKEREEIDQMKSQFFANISHEFRTPLTLILGPVNQIIEILRDDGKSIDTHKVRNGLEVVHKSADRLVRLVNQLLDLSKLESGNMTLQTSPLNIIPILRGLLQSFCSYAERKRITLSFNSQDDEIVVYIDEDKFEKIITNILSNAMKFTPDGGQVDVEVKSTPRLPQRGDSLLITIRDTGIGIPKERLPRIFDRFYQVDGSHTREHEGTGIGLSLTKELVELHGGKIEVQSEEGKGTAFVISIPLGKGHLKPEEIREPGDSQTVSKREAFSEEVVYQQEAMAEKRDNGPATGMGKPYLLIVEDNADVRNYIKCNLEGDYRILEAVDGEDGLRKSLDEMPDLVLSDVMMPKMDGLTLCNRLKTDERTSHIPVILLTAKASSEDKVEGFETGADEYVMKPFDQAELKARIKNLIEQRRRLHEHFKKQGLFELEKSNVASVDQKFLQQLFDDITRHISDPSLNVEFLVESLGMSRSVLQRKIHALVGETPGELIRRIKLKKAADLIGRKFGNISEIALEVGFNNPAYFSECFKKQYGLSPSEFQQKSAGN